MSENALLGQTLQHKFTYFRHLNSFGVPLFGRTNVIFKRFVDDVTEVVKSEVVAGNEKQPQLDGRQLVLVLNCCFVALEHLDIFSKHLARLIQ